MWNKTGHNLRCKVDLGSLVVWSISGLYIICNLGSTFDCKYILDE